MARTNERPNMYAGKCRYCDLTVEAQSGFVFDDIARNWRNAVRHSGCNEATEQARNADRLAKAAAPASSGWDAALGGKAAPARKVTLDEAFEAAVEHEVFPEAEQLHDMLNGALNEGIDTLVDLVAAEWTQLVPGMVADLLANHRPLMVQVNDMPPVDVGRAHHCFEDVLLMVVAGTSPFLVGPAGSGKTTLAEQIAKALDRKFYMAARVTSEFKLVGFIDAQGNCVRTQFREAYEHGGVFLFDEVDASDPDAMTAFNAALANGYADFPDGMVHRHPDICAIAAGNTFGRGADRQYVGRNQLDAATLDRFQIYEVDYDEELEVFLAGNEPWARYVQAVRAAAEEAKIRHVISPRASIAGAKLLAAGMSLTKVVQATIWKGMSTDVITKCASTTHAARITNTNRALLQHIAAQTEVEEAA